MLALLCLYFAVTNTRRRALFLFLSATSMACAVGARHNYLAVAMVPIAVGAWFCFDCGTTKFARLVGGLRLSLLATLPVVAVVLGLAIYNALRFGNPLDMGIRYQIGSVPLALQQHSFFQFKNVAPNFVFYLFHLPQFVSRFPYIEAICTVFRPGNGDFYQQERQFGMLAGAPMVIGLFYLLAFWKTLRVELKRFLVIGALAAGINFAILLMYAFATMRYFSDFEPVLILLAVVGWTLADARVGAVGLPARIQLQRLFFVLTLCGIAIQVLGNFPG
jgi:putative flippase GtrA